MVGGKEGESTDGRERRGRRRGEEEEGSFDREGKREREGGKGGRREHLIK